jgi:hypothetical protein
LRYFGTAFRFCDAIRINRDDRLSGVVELAIQFCECLLARHRSRQKVTTPETLERGARFRVRGFFRDLI